MYIYAAMLSIDNGTFKNPIEKPAENRNVHPGHAQKAFSIKGTSLEVVRELCFPQVLKNTSVSVTLVSIQVPAK